MPQTASELRQLPGIGDYTSAAISSIAFGEPAAAVDGNVARVIARLFTVQNDVLSNAGRKAIQQLADRLIPAQRPGDFNQAWMDLGSRVCTPKSPRCGECPLKCQCRAYLRNRTGEFPVRVGTRSAAPIVHVAVLILVRRGGEVLVRRRPPGGLWSGLWEFPNVEWRRGRAKSVLPPDLLELYQRYSPGVPEYIGVVSHPLTHKSLRMQVSQAIAGRVVGAPPRDHRWVSDEQFEALSVSTAHRRVRRLMPDDMRQQSRQRASNRQRPSSRSR
jgi:A/G-specific adenine glycosylase